MLLSQFDNKFVHPPSYTPAVARIRRSTSPLPSVGLLFSRLMRESQGWSPLAFGSGD